MNEKLYEALEVCLQAVETGAEIESVLKRYPQMADALRPILETSVRAHSLAIPSVSEDAIRRGRARVMQHAAVMRESAVKPRKAKLLFVRLATSLALALVFIISGTGLVRASDGALPGDNLYPVKRTWEDMRLFLAFDVDGRAELEDEFERERLHEIDELMAERRHETIAFTGRVTEQNEDRWLVSGILVQIMPESKLPAEPVTLGASIIVEGHTNPQGFVEADRIDLLEPGIALPSFEAVEIEDSRLEYSDNSNDIEEEMKSLKEFRENDDNINTNDGNTNDNDSRQDNSNDNDNSSKGNSNSNDDDDEPDDPDDD